QPDLAISGWRSAPVYPLYRGVMAGAIAAIRDNGLPSAQVLGSVLSGWTYQNLAIALAQDLANYKGRNLMWDFTVEHWYDDAKPGGNTMGPPHDFNGGSSVYTIQNAAGRPIFFSEFGSSSGNDMALNPKAGSRLADLLTNFSNHRDATASEPGVRGGTIYMLYQMPGVQTDYFLYHYTGGASARLSAQGQAVKRWIL